MSTEFVCTPCRLRQPGSHGCQDLACTCCYGDVWREQLCREADCWAADRPQHIHSPWGGYHIDMVNDKGETVERIPRERTAQA